MSKRWRVGASLFDSDCSCRAVADPFTSVHQAIPRPLLARVRSMGMRWYYASFKLHVLEPAQTTGPWQTTSDVSSCLLSRRVPSAACSPV
jgi:hypothetical protein